MIIYICQEWQGDPGAYSINFIYPSKAKAEAWLKKEPKGDDYGESYIETWVLKKGVWEEEKEEVCKGLTGPGSCQCDD